jgi:uncharacterized membrane protein YphA (DoxX/SURF4 family)
VRTGSSDRGVGVRMCSGRDPCGFSDVAAMLPFDWIVADGNAGESVVFLVQDRLEFTPMWTAAAIYFLVHGAGAISVDHLLIRREF